MAATMGATCACLAGLPCATCAATWAGQLAVLLGIALGAAVFTSVRLAVQATMDSYSRSMDLIAGSSDLTLFRPGGRVPDTLVTALMQHPSVRTASPITVRLCADRPTMKPPFC
jgi:putative ABC transport system permease protein